MLEYCKVCSFIQQTDLLDERCTAGTTADLNPLAGNGFPVPLLN